MALHFRKRKRWTWLRSLWTVIGLWGVIWFLLPFFSHRVINIGNITGMAGFMGLAVYGLLQPGIHHGLGWAWQSITGKVFLSVLGLLALTVVGFTLWITANMVGAAINKPSGEGGVEPTVVVLGCRVYDDRPSLALIERLDAAEDYLKTHPQAIAILSGGQGTGETVTEASAMYTYLVGKGIESHRLILEEKSTSTRENLLYSKEIIQSQALNPEMVIITNEFHQYRAGEIAKDLGISSSAISAHTAWWLLPTFYVRELYGTMYEYAF